MRTTLRSVALAGTLCLAMQGTGAVTASTPPDGDSEPAAATDTGEAFTVMTWNIHFGVGGVNDEMDLARTATVIRDESADVVALQEVAGPHDCDAPEPSPHCDTSDPHHHGDQAKQLKEMLADIYPYSHRAVAATADGGGVLILSKHPITSGSRVTIDLPYKIDGQPVGEHRAVLGGAAIDTPGRNVRVYTTHLRSGYEDRQKRLRHKQVMKIIDKRTIEAMNTPIVLAGDFNFRPTDDLKPVLANRGFIDTWTTANDSSDGMTTTKERRDCTADADQPVRRIDYVFGSPAIDVVSGAVDCDREASDHKPVIMTLRTGPPIEISGSVRAGIEGNAGWAHLIVYENQTSKMITCDNSPGDWHVLSRGHEPYQGDPGTFISGYDNGSDRDRCQVRTVGAQPISLRNMSLKTCLLSDGVEKDCRKHGMLERTYVGEDNDAGYAQFRVSADNWVKAKACDEEADGWTVRAKVWNGPAHSDWLVADIASAGNDTCRSVSGAWPWASNLLTTETCLIREGEERDCRTKPMAYAP